MPKNKFRNNLILLFRVITVFIILCLSVFLYFYINLNTGEKDKSDIQSSSTYATKNPHTKKRTKKNGTLLKYDHDKYASILIFDLNNNGAIVSKIEGSKVFFDLDNDHFKENVSWINDGDGILFLDANGNGIVDNAGELFGYKDKNIQVSGFTELLSFDHNRDNLIDKNDVIFSKLNLWQDLNRDGISQKTEINPISIYNINFINLSNISIVNKNSNGNKIISTANYTSTKDGKHEEQKIIEVSLYINQINSIYPTKKPKKRSKLDIEMDDIDDLFLEVGKYSFPKSRGYGKLKSWKIAFKENSKLVEKFEEISSLNPEDFIDENGYSSLDKKIEEFLYQWANTYNISGKRGVFDARKLVTLESLIGRGFKDQSGGTNITKIQEPFIQKSWDKLFTLFKTRLLLQTLFRLEFGNPYYSYKKDTFIFRQNIDALLSSIAKKYEAYHGVSNKSSISYLKEISHMSQGYTINKKIPILKNKDILKNKFIKKIGMYIDPNTKSIYYDSKKISNIGILKGYEYYEVGKNLNVTGCIKNKSKFKSFILNKFPRGCVVFGRLNF